jgi:hypothetical protein
MKTSNFSYTAIDSEIFSSRAASSTPFFWTGSADDGLGSLISKVPISRLEDQSLDGFG